MCLHAKTLCVYVCTACVYVFNLCSFFLCYPSFFTVGKTTLPLLTHPITKPIHAPMCTYTKAITSPKFQGNQSNSLKTLTSSNTAHTKTSFVQVLCDHSLNFVRHCIQSCLLHHLHNPSFIKVKLAAWYHQSIEASFVVHINSLSNFLSSPCTPIKSLLFSKPYTHGRFSS